MKTPVQVRLLLKLHTLEMNTERTDKIQAFKEIEKSLDSSLWRRYIKLRERKGTGVAILRNGVCSGCNMAYPDTHEILRYHNFVHSCEFCGRFLVVNGNAA